MKRIAIYDMDGTIVDSLHRYRTVKGADGVERIDLQYWRDNEHRAFDDSFLPMVEQYHADKACPDTYVVIATARVMGDADWRFVREKLGEPDYFISRKNGDSRSGALLKVLGLRRLLSLKQFKGLPGIFYEDNVAYLKAVCDAFGFKGVYCPSQQGH